jgi:hypothetical protein
MSIIPLPNLNHGPVAGVKFTANYHVPGYMADEGAVAEFDTIAEAWAWLADDRESHENEASDGCSDDVCEPGCPWRSEADLSETVAELREMSELGCVYGATPGYHGDHDLGIAYEVSDAAAW